VLLSLLLTQRLYRSIRNVSGVMMRVQAGEITARFASRKHDEISYLGDVFNRMLDDLDRYYLAQEQANRQKSILEMRLLQSQINPHLLYNSLDSTYRAVRTQDTERAAELLVKLSAFFKISLSRGAELIPLENELKLIQCYVDVQRLAQEKEYRLVVDVPEEALAVKICKLTLQPLVENAILHAFPGFRDDGVVAIRVETGGDSLRFTVEDNGIGFEPEELSGILALLSSNSPSPAMDSYGLYNVNQRLQREFGEAAALRIDSVVGEYTRIRFEIPRLPGGKTVHA
jgi:two-component system, sensor histidine kinase YesM